MPHFCGNVQKKLFTGGLGSEMIIRLEPVQKFCSRYWFSVSLVILFCLLVSLGITGSSLGFYKGLPGCDELISLSGERKVLGVYRGVRGDEFIAHGTATALQQYHHDPKFPLLNTNCGVEGRNNLVLHDTGAPVRHLSALGRPAVWGFFFLDLRRALSWYWFLPLFLGLWGCKFLLDRLFPEQEIINVLLSCSLIFSAYAGAWSFWPVNNVYGLFIAGAVVIEMIRRPDRWYKYLLALIAGWMLFCSFMSLYMPRVIPALYLVAAVVAVYFHQHKLWKELLKTENLFPLLTVVFIFALFAALWFLDARSVIERIWMSAYPGNRLHSGGDLPWWMFHAGYFSLLTIYKTDFSNQCELQSFFNILPLFLIWFIVNFRRLQFRRMWWVLWGVAAVTGIYQITGFPHWLGEITFMLRTTPIRCLWVFNILQVFMLALYWYESRHSDFSISGVWSWSITSGMMVYAGVALALIPLQFYRGISVYAGYVLILSLACMIVFIFGILGWTISRKPLIFIAVYAVVNMVPGMIFNPVCIAPEKIENRFIAPEEAAEMPFAGRGLFAAGNDFLAVAYSLCGGRVFNGYFLYYDAGIDELLFEKQPERHDFHRMNHLDINLSGSGSALLTARVPYPDRIEVTINGAEYDFAKLPIDVVVAKNADREKLENNPSLEFWKNGRYLCFFKVVRKK